MGTTFEDSFWETDFTGTIGFDVLNRRMKDGQKMCHDIIEFFKKRAKADQQYSKTLRNIARAAEEKDDGDLGVSWKTTLCHTEMTANFHENSCLHYTRLADDLSKYADAAKLEIRQYEDKVKERQKTKKVTHGKMIECQKSYIDKCREFLNLEQQYESANVAVSTSSKELEKLKAKMDKSRENMEKADIAYKQSVDTLEHARVSWITDMEYCCQNFQRLEEERIYLIRDELWKCSNIDSQLCVNLDESCETIRLSLETCDIQKEIQDFIRTNTTGTVRPGRIWYDNYFSDQSTRNKDLSVQMSQIHNQNDYTSVPYTKHLPPAINLLPTQMLSLGNSSPPSPRTPPVPAPRVSLRIAKFPQTSTVQGLKNDNDEDMYAVVD